MGVLGHVPTEHGRARPSWTDSSRVVAEGQSREFCLRRAEACRYRSGPRECMLRENEEHSLKRAKEG